MDIKKLARELNKVLGLDPEIPLDNEKSIKADLVELATDPEWLTPDDFNPGGISKAAAALLLKMKLVPESVIPAVQKRAGIKVKKVAPKAEAPKTEKEPVKKEAPKTEKEPVKKEAPKTEKEPVKKERKQREAKKESNQAIVDRMLSEGKTEKSITKALADKYAGEGKSFTDEWVEGRAKIYIKLSPNSKAGK